MKLHRPFVSLILLAAISICPAAEPPTSSPKAQVLVAYHSLTGNTKAMGEGVVEGVQQVPGVAATLKPVDEVTVADLEGADGIILGCPTYYGTIPGAMKVVIDDWSWKIGVRRYLGRLGHELPMATQRFLRQREQRACGPGNRPRARWGHDDVS